MFLSGHWFIWCSMGNRASLPASQICEHKTDFRSFNSARGLESSQFPKQRCPADSQMPCQIFPGTAKYNFSVFILTGKQKSNHPSTAGLHGKQFNSFQKKLDLLATDSCKTQCKSAVAGHHLLQHRFGNIKHLCFYGTAEYSFQFEARQKITDSKTLPNRQFIEQDVFSV